MNLAPIISKQKAAESFFESLLKFPIFEYDRVKNGQVVVIPSRGNGKSLYQRKLIEAIMQGR